MSGWSDQRTSTQNSSDDNGGRSVLSAEIDLKSPDQSVSDNNSSVASSKFPLRRIGDLFRSKLRSSGSYSIRALEDSVPQECKIADGTVVPDVEKTVTAAKKPDRPALEVPTVAAVVVNEKSTRSGSTVVGASSSGGTALRARRMSTLNRTIQRQKSLIASINSEKGQPSSSNGQNKRQSISSQDTSGEIESDVVVGKSVGRERINSTSHYSTEKSGSSGYYSTNIYFAGGSVVDDHIYYEPVVDRGARKPTTTESGNKPTGATTVGKKEGILKNSGSKAQDANKAAQRNGGRTLEKYYYPATLENVPNDVAIMRAKTTTNEKLTDITEGPLDGSIPRPIWPLDVDDSLADINLEAFKMRHNSQQNLIGFESPASSNSDNELYSVSKKNLDDTAKKKSQSQSQYEEYLEFHNTRNILEQIRGKLNTLLDQRTEGQKQSGSGHGLTEAEAELEDKIANLKSDLEGYLQSMNQKNENEIKRFCKGMSKDAKLVAVQNAVEHRNRSRGSSVNFENDYEVLENHTALDQSYYPTVSQRTLTRYPIPEGQPSLFETVYVRDGFNVRQLNRPAPNPFAQEARSTQMLLNQRSIYFQPQQQQFQHQHPLQQQQQPIRYMSNAEINALSNYEVCERRPSKVSIEIPPDDGSKSGAHVVVDGSGVGIGGIVSDLVAEGRVRRKSELSSNSNSNNVGKASGDVSDFTLQRVILMESLGKNGKVFGDKEKMLLEYHLNKPSYWELYYGANREEQKPHHTLIRKVKIGGKNAISVSYPSTRPESDFTLDLPRAEQLRVKMKKEKQFRSRCRWFFYFLSVVFFLLSVMVVSLVLTRGKRMFGSMI